MKIPFVAAARREIPFQPGETVFDVIFDQAYPQTPIVAVRAPAVSRVRWVQKDQEFLACQLRRMGCSLHCHRNEIPSPIWRKPSS